MTTRTLLFADQVASTRQLLELGDARAAWIRRALLDMLRESVHLANGRIVDTAGDGIFAAFDSAAAGFEAATSMLQLADELNRRVPEAERIELRVGLHVGEPVAQADGSLFGAAVVVARRLCERARPGELVVSELVLQLTGSDPERERLGRIELKGIPDPVDASAVVVAAAPLHAPPVAEPVWPVVGRDAEIERIVAGGPVVLVEGPEGIGVSSVLGEVARRFHGDGWTVRSVATPPAGSEFGWWSEVVARHAELTPTALLRLDLGREGGELVRLVPELVERVPGLPRPSASEAGVETYLVADAVEALLLRVRRTRPLVVVIDDAEHVDPGSVRVLERMLRRGRVDDVRFVIGRHPDPRHDRLEAIGSFLESVRIPPLDERATAALVDSLVGHRDDALVSAVYAETLGHPFFAVEIVRARRSAEIEARLGGMADEARRHRRELRQLTGEIATGLRELDLLTGEPGPPTDDGELEPDGTPPAPLVAPYLGPLPYGVADADRFAGRTDLIAELVARAASTNCLVVVGPSGSGKTSVVFGGLVPALQRSPLREATRMVTLRPGRTPVAGLLAAAGMPEETVDDTPIVAALVGDGHGLVIVDQLEELFTNEVDEPEQVRFLGLLAAAAEDTSVIAVIRSDFVDRLALHPGFGRRAEEGMVLVGPIGPDELREVVLRPAAAVGLVVDPDVVELVVADAADQNGALPHVSTALLAAFERRRGRSMTAASYREAGGVAGALAALADATHDALDPEEQTAARRLFGRLAHAGRGGDDLRRTVPFDELSTDHATMAVVDRFVERRLLVRTETGVEVAHEALLRDWPRARDWLAADRDDRRTHQQLTAAAAEWTAGGRDPELLWRSGRATVAADWLGTHGDWVNDDERAFVDASATAAGAELAQAQRLNRRLRSLAGVVGVLLAIAMVAAGLALRGRQTAQRRARVETAERLAAQAAELAGSDAPLALLVGLEGRATNASVATAGGLLSSFGGIGHLADAVADGEPGIVPAASLDAEVVAVPSVDGGVEVRSPDAAPLRLDPLGGDGIVGLALDPAGALLAVAGANGGLELWSTDDGTLISKVDTPAASSAFLLFSPSATRLALGSQDGTVRTFDVPGLQGGDVVVEFPSRPVVTFGDDDHLVASGGFAAGAAVDLVEGTTIAFGPEFQGPSAAVFTADGSEILASDTDGAVARYSAETGEVLGEVLDPLGETPSDLALSADGTRLVVGLTGGDVAVVDIATGEVADRFRTASAVSDVWVSDDGRVVSRSAGRLSVWDLDQVHPLVERTALAGGSAVVTSPAVDGHLVVVDVVGGTAERWDAATGRPDGPRYEIGRPFPFAASISPDGATVVITSLRDFETGGGPLVQRFDAATAELLGEVEMAAPSFSVAHDPTGGSIATFDDPDRLVLRGSTSLESQIEVEGLGPTWNLDWSADGAAVYVAGGDLFRVDARTGAVTTIVGGPGDVYSVDALPDGRVLAGAGSRLVVIGADGEVDGSINLESNLIDVTGDVERGVAAAVTAEGTLRLVDLAELRVLGPPVPISTGTGRKVHLVGTDVTGSSDDGTVFRMSLDIDRWVEAACRLAGRNLTAVERDQYGRSGEEPTCSDWPAVAAD